MPTPKQFTAEELRERKNAQARRKVKMETEIWKDVPGWGQYYEASDFGNIRSKLRARKPRRGAPLPQRGGRAIKAFPNKKGYMLVNLAGGGKRKQVLVHLAVIQAFFGSAPNGQEACHNDGVKANCTLSNLRYDTRKNNHADKIRHGTAQRGEKNSVAKLTDDAVRVIRAGKLSVTEAMRAFGVSQGCIQKVKYKTAWKHVES